MELKHYYEAVEQSRYIDDDIHDIIDKMDNMIDELDNEVTYTMITDFIDESKFYHTFSVYNHYYKMLQQNMRDAYYNISKLKESVDDIICSIDTDKLKGEE